MIALHVSGRERAVSWWSGGNQWLRPVAGARRPGIWSIERAPLAVLTRTAIYTRNPYLLNTPARYSLSLPDKASIPRTKKNIPTVWAEAPTPPRT